MPTKSCPQCSKEFKVIPSRKKYCSRDCYQDKQRQAAMARDVEQSYARRRAASVTPAAITSRKIRRQPCEVCGRPKAVAHHDDYAAPLEVRWLCHAHHAQHHHQHGPGKNA